MQAIAHVYQTAPLVQLHRAPQRLSASTLKLPQSTYVKFQIEECFVSASQTTDSFPQEYGSHYGSLVHELFVFLSQGNDLAHFIPSSDTARFLDLFPNALSDAYTCVKALQQSQFWQAQRAGKKCSFEFPFLMQIDLWTIDGRIDILLEGQDDIFIFDLKTDSLVRPQSYAAQLAVYRHAVDALFVNEKIHAGLIYIRKGIVAWLDEPIDEQKIAEWCNGNSEKQEF